MESTTATANPPAASQPRPVNTTDSGKRSELVRAANEGDARAAIDLMRERSACEELEPVGLAAIRLRRPRRRVFAKVPRRLADVDRGLCDLFGDICNGVQPWPLFIHGPVGTGKTYAGLALADMVEHASYCTLDELCSDVMAGQRPWRDFSSDDDHLLIVDEIGERAKVGDLLYVTLKSVLDNREFRHRRRGIYISNLPPAELVDLFDDRIASRLTCGSVYRLDGADRRHQGSR